MPDYTDRHRRRLSVTVCPCQPTSMAGKDSYRDNELHQSYTSPASIAHRVVPQRSVLRGWIPFSRQTDWEQLLQSLKETEFFQKADNKTQEELLRTTQLVYSYQAGKMVPRLREPRQLFGFNAETGGVNQGARWPSEIQVLNERIVHITGVPIDPEPFYVKTGLEKTPMSRSHNGQGRVVYEYEPVVGSFFLRSRVGGCRSGCTQVAVELTSDEDKTLVFESRFESGNLFKAVQVGEFEYELWLRNDLYTNKHTQWFYFRVSNTRANATYRFTIVNLMKPDSLYNNGMKPLMYSEREAKESKVGWRRTGNEIKYYRNNIGYTMGKTDRWYYSLTWTCQFKYDKDTVYFSHCYPYTYTNMQDYLSEIASDPVKSKLCKQRVLCRTLAGNLVYVLTITSPTKTPEEMKLRKAVVLTSRVHPGESNSSWMMKGFLDYLLGSSADAKLLRDTFVFKIVPMLNPDGVIVGNYRCSLAGRDLNRNYKTVLKDSFPSVWHTKAMVKKLVEEREVIVYCDLHGHSRKHNVFIYGCENRGNPQKRLKERVFPVMLSKNAPDKFHFEYCKFKVQKSKEGTGRVVMWNMGILNSFTMEATFAGSSIGKKKGYHFSMADLEAMGYHFCDTLLDYCDPDNTKCTNIMLELEDKLRQEILQHLKQKEGQDIPDVSEINLDEAFSTDLESSDGGSDSSVSDGLPAHLQYIAQKTSFTKKKRLRTRKERDKHKCSGTKDDGKKPASNTPVSMETEKKDLSKTTKTKTSVAKRPKSNEKTEKINVSTSTKDLQEEKSENRVGPEGYLEALTNAYIRNGVLNTDQTREIPHFRYTAAGGQAPVTLEGLCPHHDQTFAAQYMANHLQQFKYPVVLEKARCFHCESAICKAYDLSELPKYKFQMRGSSAGTKATTPVSGSRSPSMLERRSSGRHIVELAAAQTRQKELAMNEARAQEVNRDDVNGPIKQHPPPFDDNFDKQQHTYEVIKRGTSAKSVRAGSSRPASRGPSSRPGMARPWVDSAGSGLQGVVMLGPAEADGRVWDNTTNRTDTAPSNTRVVDSNWSDSDRPGAESRQGSSVGMRARSSRSRYTPTEGGRNVAYVPATSKHNCVVPPSTSDYVQVKPKERTSLLPSSHAQRPTQLHNQDPPSQNKAKPLSMHNTPASSHISSTEEINRLTQGNSQVKGNFRHSDSDQKLIQEEMTSTMQSITEITESLLDPSQRASLSPTTGNFVEHFVKKTEAEISDIAAEIQQKLHSVQNEDRPRPASATPPGGDELMVELDGGAVGGGADSRRHESSSESSSELMYTSGPAIVPRKATKLVDDEDGRLSTVVTTYETHRAGNKVVVGGGGGGGGGGDPGATPGPARPIPNKSLIGRESYDGGVGVGHADRAMTTVGTSNRTPRDRHAGSADWLDDGQMAQVSLASVTLHPRTVRQHVSARRQTQPADDGYSTSSCREARADVDTDDGSPSRADLNQSSATTKRMSSSPTKISLMISRGHQREHNPTGNHGNQFHAYPLTRQPRPPVLRSMPKRR